MSLVSSGDDVKNKPMPIVIICLEAALAENSLSVLLGFR